MNGIGVRSGTDMVPTMISEDFLLRMGREEKTFSATETAMQSRTLLVASLVPVRK